MLFAARPRTHKLLIRLVLPWWHGVCGVHGLQRAFAARGTSLAIVDANRDGFVSKVEVKSIEGYEKFFAEADENRDGRLDPSEFMTFQSLRDGAYLAQVASDSAITAKVKAALLREPSVDSLDVSVETYKSRVLLSGFVKDDAQRRKAIQVAAAVSGVTSVKNGLAVR